MMYGNSTPVVVSAGAIWRPLGLPVADGLQAKPEVVTLDGLGPRVAPQPSSPVRPAAASGCAPVLDEGDRDIYALLRRQYKPVEMIMISNGAHPRARNS
jgi:hypothetical protein